MKAMKTGKLVQGVSLCGVVVLGALLMIASGPDNPPSATPTNPVVKVEGPPPGGSPITIAPHVPLHYAALPLRSQQNGTQILFNAPSPTTLKVSVLDPSSGTSVLLPVITAAQSPPASTPTTGFARTDGFDTTATPVQWMVTVRPPDSFYALGTFTINISVVSLDTSQTGAALEAPPLSLVMETFRISVTLSGGSGPAVTSVPNGIACGRGGDCVHDFPPPGGAAGNNITLVPEETSADLLTCFHFQGWSGDCSGTGTCAVSLDGTMSKSVGAAFDSGQPCTGSPVQSPWCTAPQKSMPGCGASTANPGGVASCDDGGWFCCSKAAPSKDTSGCSSGYGPAYGAVTCLHGGSPSNEGCQ
jgi:hypothetical protein